MRAYRLILREAGSHSPAGTIFSLLDRFGNPLGHEAFIDCRIVRERLRRACTLKRLRLHFNLGHWFLLPVWVPRANVTFVMCKTICGNARARSEQTYQLARDARAQRAMRNENRIISYLKLTGGAGGRRGEKAIPG